MRALSLDELMARIVTVDNPGVLMISNIDPHHPHHHSGHENQESKDIEVTIPSSAKHYTLVGTLEGSN